MADKQLVGESRRQRKGRQRVCKPTGRLQKGCHHWQSVAVQTLLVCLVTRGLQQPEDLLVKFVI